MYNFLLVSELMFAPGSKDSCVH